MLANRRWLFALCLLNTWAFADDSLELQAIGIELSACTGIENDEGRLTCYDALVQADRVNKRSVDLTQTLKTAITGHPQIVLNDDPAARAVSKTPDARLPKETQSPLTVSYDLGKNSERGLWSARPHNANYLLPIYLNSRRNYHPTTPTQTPPTPFTGSDINQAELKFQLSLKAKAAENLFGTDADLWLGYTQLSHWQVYNKNNSRPFRTHDYEPELFLTQPVRADLPFGGQLRLLGVGAIHHSNGEKLPVSRSWNRLYAMGGAEWGRLTVMPRIWTRVTKKDQDKPNENPDIEQYYGYGDIKFIYQLNSGANVSGLARLNPSNGKGAVQLDYAYPLQKGVTGYVQTFYGYGQSLIDYNHKAASVGVGVMLTDWLGL